ncbi:MAG: VOC family protein [Pseudomonadota bacterium]
MQLSRLFLNVLDADTLATFYTDVLGMRDLGQPGSPALGYDTGQCLLAFNAGDFGPYEPAPNDLYWKIGITLRDLDRAVAYLRERGWPVTDTRQFRDIGYMAHLNDPEGFAIELLQQGFEGNAAPAGNGHPIGGQAILAHLTLRITDLAAAQRFCEGQLGMRLMSIQPVPERGFTLCFYAWSDEPLPDPDLKAVENREWLWARPYTLLELQHWHETDGPMARPRAHLAGFAGFAYGGDVTDLIRMPLSTLADLL